MFYVVPLQKFTHFQFLEKKSLLTSDYERIVLRKPLNPGIIIFIILVHNVFYRDYVLNHCKQKMNYKNNIPY